MKHLLLLASTALLGACATTTPDPLIAPPPESAPAPVVAALAPVAAPNAALAAFFDEADKAELAQSPNGKAYRGIRDADYGKWNDYRDSAAVARQQRLQARAAQLRSSFDPSTLNAQDALSVRLFDRDSQRSATLFPYRRMSYLFDQMNGQQSAFPAFLINIHSVANEEQAEAYVSRIAGVGTALDQLIEESRARADMGVMPPKWVYAYVLTDIDNLLNATPANNAVLADFRTKVGKLDLAQATRTSLEQRAAAAWSGSAAPAYRRLRAEMVRQQARAGNVDGIWRLERGADYYNALLANYTTTNLTADQIHDLGLRETARIQGEVRKIMARVGFTGSMQEFFTFARTDPRFFPKSREEYLAKTDAALKAMDARLPDYFSTLPKAPLVVKAVEPFREKSAGKAFYSSPAPDGSRPGTYYVNLYDLKAMSLNELEALAFHEGVPGHHLQRAVQTELGDKVPAFRRFGGYTAYTEGWGLYSEELAKDMGFYTDPYSDLGRLSMEALRAGRLVVDTGIHAKRWSREQAIEWFLANTPVARGDIVNQVERYVVYPGQATSYMVGKLKLMELREKARTELGPKFDYKGFHDAVLLTGPVPLDVLEENVAAWVARQKAS
nr:DUF885 domain-containing protein [uncultured Sphingomonas sp.]